QALEREEQYNQAIAEADAAHQAQKIAEAEGALARAAALRAQISLLRQRVADSEIRAPIDGVIVGGDLRDRIGARTEMGEALYEIAQLADLLVVMQIPDRDIAYIEEQATGRLAMRARPEYNIHFVVDTVVPLAQAKEGANLFEARAEIGDVPPWLRPGAEGIARIDTGDRRLYWILKRRIEDTIRLWMWW